MQQVTSNLISFIIIGKNESLHIERCINSILLFNSVNHIINYEIIYIDSNSYDNSILIVKKYPQIKIYKIVGRTNAALGRNLGAAKSLGKVIIFIDGDMELLPQFFKNAFIPKYELRYPFISGQFTNIYTNDENKEVYREPYFKNLSTDDSFQITAGGFFAITRDLWNSVNGMNTKYRIGEDIDLALRIFNKHKLPLLRIKEISALHYTEPIKSPTHLYNRFFNGNELYTKALMYREHLFHNKKTLTLLLNQDYSLIILLICIFSTLIIKSTFLSVPYLVVIVLRAISISKTKLFNSPKYILYYFLRDLSNLFGFLFFFPKRINEKQYIIEDCFETIVNNFSFIVIGKNEESNLDKCIKSINNFISENRILNSEIIYIDSSSIDNSIQIAKSNKVTHIYQLIKPCNAAIARNLGTSKAQGNILVFLDGDMTISPEFYKHAFRENLIIYPFLSGQFIDNYSSKSSHFRTEYYRNLKPLDFSTLSGGVFIITRDLYNLINGMDQKYKRGQDLDFTLKLRQINIPLLRLNKIIANHYSLHPHSINYLLTSTRAFGFLYSNCVLYREHIFTDKLLFRIFFRQEYTFILLMITLICTTIYPSFVTLTPYFILVLAKALANKNFNIRLMAQNIFTIIIKDLLLMPGILLFYPNRKPLNYVNIKK